MVGKKDKVILVVEDEPLIMMDAVAILESARFQCVEAASADEAVGLLQNRNDIAAVFTDIQIIGDPDGLKLAHIVRDRWPPMGLIVTSGRIKVDPAEMPSGGIFLPKPYDGANLVRCLNAVLEDAGT